MTMAAPRAAEPDQTGGNAGRTGGLERTRWQVPLGLALFVLAVVLPLLRQQGFRVWETVWAEDGAIYWPQASQDGLRTLFRAHDGYLQFGSRLLTAPVSLVPASQVAIYLAVVAALASALIAAFVFRSTEGWVRSYPVRVVVAGMYVIGPAVAWETTGDATNIIWPLLAAAPWAIVSTRRAPADVVARCGIAALAALSHPLAAVFLPLAAVAAWGRRRRDSTAVLVVLGLAVVAQAAMMAVASARHPASSSSVGELVSTVSVDVLGSFLVGERPLPWLWASLGVGFAAAAALVVTAVFVVAAWGAAQRHRVVAAFFVVGAAVIACAPFWANGTAATALVAGQAPIPAQRYVVVPVALLVGAMAILVDPVDASRRRLVARVGRPLLVLQVAIVVASSFLVTTPRSLGPVWMPQVEDAQARCAEGSGTIELRFSPIGWHAIVPCDAVEP
jgi:hypothetical protein